MSQLSTSFHNSIDLARGFQTYTTDNMWRPWPPLITLEERRLAYQFFTHFHPYVPALIQNLNQGGLPQLEQSDTLYLPQPNPVSAPVPLNIIPDSTRATLLSAVSVTPAGGGSPIALTAGTPMTLQHGTTVSVPAGTLVGNPDGSTSPLGAAVSFPLPGWLPVSFSSGIQNSTGAGAIIVLDSTAVTLPAGAPAVLTSDGAEVTLPANTSVAIRSGLPQPFYYVDDFASRYSPDTNSVEQPYPVRNLDFSTSGAYSIYNWELFFHAPLLIAIHLSQNQKFQDAENWFQYIFNPTDNTPGPTPQRFWKVAPFQYTDTESIEQILVNLAQPQDPQLYTDTVNSIQAWQQNPFQPWLVGRFRPTAYMLKTVMAYLDNKIAWADSLFRTYTVETIREATQHYVTCANILGFPKPQPVPNKGTVKTLTYNALKNAGLDPFGNAMVDMEVDMPFDLNPPAGSGTNPTGAQILPSIGKTLYFCIPQNDQFLSYWDTVADRLFKIHNSLNIQGIFQQLPLYDPPIDPALLVRATAAGLNVSSIVSGLNQPLPLVRFQFLIAKAIEICQEVKSLGANLLSVIEKQDNESLSLLRAQHESTILNLANVVKYSQWQEAQKATQGLQSSFDNLVQRYSYYQKLLGRTDAQITSSIPQLDPLDLGTLENLNFSQTDASSEPTMPLDTIDPQISQDSLSVSDGGIQTLSNHEVEELEKLGTSHDYQLAASGIEGLNGVLSVIPDAKAHVQPLGCGATLEFGGKSLHNNMSALASVSRAFAEEYSYEAGKAGKLGSYSRRQLEWTFQSNSAKSEINQIFKQIRAAQIREAIAKNEYDHHQTAMANAQQIVDFLQGNDAGTPYGVKETTAGFYAFQKRDLKALYNNSFQLVYEIAKRAERCLQNELGDSSLTYIGYSYLDGNEGLLAGEKLLFDLKTMEMAYHDLNMREYELTKQVSLRQLDPVALLQLRATGACQFTLPEELFDLDGPGHYFRRARSIAVTIPCVAGPYTSVNCTLSVVKSTIRTSTDPGKTYTRQGSDDSRFNDYYGTIQSIVTSSAQADTGLFDTNLKDERYLPFEALGIAGSQISVSLPAEVRQFDFDTITDFILHIRYTAREGGELLNAAAVQNLQNKINKAQTVGSVSLFSLRHDFPSQWAKFQSVTIGGATPTAELPLTLTSDLYPFWAQGVVGSGPLKAVQFFAEMAPGDKTTTIHLNDKAAGSGNSDTLALDPAMGGLLSGALTKIALPATVTDSTHPGLDVFLDNNSMQDLWIALTWGKS